MKRISLFQLGLAAAAIVAAPFVATAAPNRPASRPAARTAAPAPAPADLIKTRVAGMREVGAAMKAINDGLRSPEPQVILIQQSARQMKNSSVAAQGWFPAASAPAPGLKTSAKPEIWTQQAQFGTAMSNFVGEAAAFQTVANGGNIDAIKAEVRRLGGTCKGCHDNFKVPQQQP